MLGLTLIYTTTLFTKLESCFCVSGHGWIHDLESGISHEIKKGTIYILDNHDNHEFEALEDTICLEIYYTFLEFGDINRRPGSQGGIKK